MTEPAKSPDAAQFDACCETAGIVLAPAHKPAVLRTAQWLAEGLARLRQTYPDATKGQK